MVEFLIAVGEVFTGLGYTLVGLIFCIQSIYTSSTSRTYFRAGIAALFIVAGLEELADAVVSEGSGALALWVQGILTFAQFVTVAVALWVVFKAELLTADYAKRMGAE